MMMSNVVTVNIPEKRIYGLDILRALAIIFVMVGHGNGIISGHIPSWIQHLMWIDGVSIFFVLSGFLIGNILIKHFHQNGVNRTSIVDFWLRRWFRTIPTYFIVLGILTIISIFVDGRIPKSLGRYYTFTQNLTTVHPGFFPEAWSLSVEEWFYLLLPILIFVLTRLTRPSNYNVLYISVFVIVAIPIFRCTRAMSEAVETYSQWDTLFRKQVVTRLDSLMYGVAGAWTYNYIPKLWNNRNKLLFFLGITILIMDKFLFMFKHQIGLDFTPYYSIFSFSVFSLGILLILPFLSNLKSGNGFIYKILTKISLISYSMYLIHFSIVLNLLLPVLFKKLINTSVIISFVEYFIFWFVTIALASMLYNLVEIPTTGWRNKISNRNKLNDVHS
jgi:peptidoglycan/LPS O-acetylase OafA/YrhL